MTTLKLILGLIALPFALLAFALFLALGWMVKPLEGKGQP